MAKSKKNRNLKKPNASNLLQEDNNPSTTVVFKPNLYFLIGSAASLSLWIAFLGIMAFR